MEEAYKNTNVGISSISQHFRKNSKVNDSYWVILYHQSEVRINRPSMFHFFCRMKTWSNDVYVPTKQVQGKKENCFNNMV